MSDNHSERTKTRLTESSGPHIPTSEPIDKNASALIGGDFIAQPNAPFLSSRDDLFSKLFAKQTETIAKLQNENRPIEIILPNENLKESGQAYLITPLDIIKRTDSISSNDIVVAKVRYHNAKDQSEDPLSIDTSANIDGNESSPECCSAHANGHNSVSSWELWDLKRALIGDCDLKFIKFDEEDGRMVFWHSSAHILGEAMEQLKGCFLTIGPPVEGGFYYDAFMGNISWQETEWSVLEKTCQKIVKENQNFERLVLTKEEALELFADNVFKTQLIATKIPEGGKTTAYRCGSLIDLCRGPHVLSTGRVKALAITKTSSTYWLGKTTNDSLQRVYGVSFPTKAQLKEWKHFQAEAIKRDHRRLGLSHDLYFFHSLSPGSAFWLPNGAHIFSKLLEFLRAQYRERGYNEVITPNMFNMELWNTSGHAAHYKENMFVFEVESQEFALKPMNCPSHCLMFDHRLRSYRELPIRYADFGVLHRNELSGALTGLTRVRRFQQDDAHIFCREDQIKREIIDFLQFMKFVYDTFDIRFQLELSTRPAKAMGELTQWEQAESQLASALDEFIGKDQWRENPGDGAFYGPKIDIMITDALKRQHQCATVQLDFQLPIRFNLKYRSDDEEGYKRPIIIHRAIYGSLERFVAVLVEHYAAKFPFWLSPRQVLIVTVGHAFVDYGYHVKEMIFRAGFQVEIEDSGKTLNKKIREGQLAHYNFILVVGAKEKETQSVNIRTRDNKVHGTKTIDEAIAMFQSLQNSRANE